METTEKTTFQNLNSGYRNSGDWNSGDWNKSNRIMTPTENYKGCEIIPHHMQGYTWEHPNSDYAPDTGCYGMGHENTIEECKEAIDEFLEDDSERIYSPSY